MKSFHITASVLALAAASALPAFARDQVHVAGSSTVLPLAQIVAEGFAENFPDFRAPVVEGGGTGAGLSRFCEGVGPATIDIATASRSIRKGEFEACVANGVTEIMEVRIGHDGIVFASAVGGPEFNLTAGDVYNAIAAQVNVDGAIVANTFTSYAQFNPALPDQEILMWVPGTKHGTRDVFDSYVILEGCEETGAYDLFLAAAPGADDDAKAEAAEEACNALRTDGRSVDIDGDYTETLMRLEANPTSVGVFGLPFYMNNTDRLRVATFGGVVPSIESVATGEYPVSRPLFIYVKLAHIGVIPGLQEFVEFFVSDEVAGMDSPLALYGMVPEPELAAVQELVRNRVAMAPVQ